MTVDDLVTEGGAFRLAHPTARRRKVQSYLECLTAPSSADTRAAVGAGGPEGLLGAVLLMPVLSVVALVRQRRHRRVVAEAMRVLFPDGPGPAGTASA